MLRMLGVEEALKNFRGKFANNESEEIIKVTEPKPVQYGKKTDQFEILEDKKKMKVIKNLRDFKPSLERLGIKSKECKKYTSSSSESEEERRSNQLDVVRKIKEIKCLIEMTKLQERQKRNMSHENRVNRKNYLKTLSKMQQRLKEIEYEYFTIPNMISKTIKDFKEEAVTNIMDTTVFRSKTPPVDTKLALKRELNNSIIVRPKSEASNRMTRQRTPSPPQEGKYNPLRYSDAFFPSRYSGLFPTSTPQTNLRKPSSPRPKTPSPPRQRISSPPPQRISSPPRQRISSPPRQRISSPPRQRISSPPRHRQFQEKRSFESGSDVEYADAFFPKREAVIPPNMFPKKNHESRDQTTYRENSFKNDRYSPVRDSNNYYDKQRVTAYQEKYSNKLPANEIKTSPRLFSRNF